MKTHITLLDGDRPSTKHYTIDPDTDIAKKGTVSTSYLHNSVSIDIDNIVDLFDVLVIARNNPNAFVIRGQGKQDIQQGIRRTKDDPNNFDEVATAWVCLDFDEWILAGGHQVPARCDPAAIEHIIQWDLPPEFHNASYIFQWSASAGLEYNHVPVKKGTNLHLFFMLDRALLDRELVAWLENIGGQGNFDTSVFRTITPIFVGNHIVRDHRIKDIIKDQDKFGIVAREYHQVTVPEITIRPQHRELDSIDFDTTNDILQKLQSVGAVYKRSGSWLKLKHPGEKTAGDWHVRYDSPGMVHHHVKTSVPVTQWLKEFYGVDFSYERTLSQSEYFKRSYGQRFDSRKITRK